MGHPAPGFINAVNWHSNLGLGDRMRACRRARNVSFEKPVLWPEEPMTYWEGGGVGGSKRKEPSFKLAVFVHDHQEVTYTL